jgi:hypothetical protein
MSMARKKRTPASPQAYAASDTCSSPQIREALNYSRTHSSGTGTISTANIGQDREAKKRFDDNYEAIFGHG